jgi:hypothetical protein
VRARQHHEDDDRYDRIIREEVGSLRQLSIIALHPRYADVCWLMGAASAKHPMCLGPSMNYVAEVACRYLAYYDIPWEDARIAIMDGHYNPASPSSPDSIRARKPRSKTAVRRLFRTLLSEARGQLDNWDADYGQRRKV